MKRLTIFFSFFLLVFISNSYAQVYTAKILDKATEDPIPFVSIQFSEKGGTITNKEGVFKFEKTKKSILNDSIEISYLGYKTKKIAIQKKFPKIIYLTEEINALAPIFLINKNISATEIIKKVQQNTVSNYKNEYAKAEVFIRETYDTKIKKFKIDLKKSTIDNIDQKLFDTFLKDIPEKFTTLIESFGNAYFENLGKSKLEILKLMVVASKKQKKSAKKIENNFLKMLQENTKPNSYLIIKSGFVRLDKTESIDSIIASNSKTKKRDTVKMNKWSLTYRTQILNENIKNVFLNKDATVNFINKASRYEFTKTGYVEIGDDFAYVITFKPKRGAAYKGTLYINTTDFGILKAEIENAQNIYDKKFNMFGINVNDLSFKSTILFQKNKENNKYLIKYLKTALVEEASIDRPIKIIEKNKFVKGRRKQNQVSLRFKFYSQYTSKLEMVFNNNIAINKETYQNYKPSAQKIERKRFNQYNKHFWKGYTIITPEKAIEELKIIE